MVLVGVRWKTHNNKSRLSKSIHSVNRKNEIRRSRKVAMRLTDDGMSSIQIEKQLRNVVNQRTIRRWQNLYRETGEIDSKNQLVDLKLWEQKVLCKRWNSDWLVKDGGSARQLGKSFGVSRESMRRITKKNEEFIAILGAKSIKKKKVMVKIWRWTSTRWWFYLSAGQCYSSHS